MEFIGAKKDTVEAMMSKTRQGRLTTSQAASPIIGVTRCHSRIGRIQQNNRQRTRSMLYRRGINYDSPGSSTLCKEEDFIFS